MVLKFSRRSLKVLWYLISLPFRWLAVSVCLIAALPTIIFVFIITGENIATELEEILREQWFDE